MVRTRKQIKATGESLEALSFEAKPRTRTRRASLHPKYVEVCETTSSMPPERTTAVQQNVERSEERQPKPISTQVPDQTEMKSNDGPAKTSIDSTELSSVVTDKPIATGYVPSAGDFTFWQVDLSGHSSGVTDADGWSGSASKDVQKNQKSLLLGNADLTVDHPNAKQQDEDREKLELIARKIALRKAKKAAANIWAASREQSHQPPRKRSYSQHEEIAEISKRPKVDEDTRGPDAPEEVATQLVQATRGRNGAAPEAAKTTDPEDPFHTAAGNEGFGRGPEVLLSADAATLPATPAALPSQLSVVSSQSTQYNSDDSTLADILSSSIRDDSAAQKPAANLENGRAAKQAERFTYDFADQSKALIGIGLDLESLDAAAAVANNLYDPRQPLIAPLNGPESNTTREHATAHAGTGSDELDVELFGEDPPEADEPWAIQSALRVEDTAVSQPPVYFGLSANLGQGASASSEPNDSEQEHPLWDPHRWYN